jgi:hypothetical protein
MGKRVAVANKVWTFFRNIHSITPLGTEIGLSIVVIDKEFDPDRRKAYLSEIKAEINKSRRPLALFLDPDTGLQPKKCLPEHTSIAEIQELWPMLKPGEWLILYQHARRTLDWRESVANELSSLCNRCRANIVRSDDIGKDVTFICVQNDGKA